MKKNNTLKVVLIAILATFLLTWLLPITYYNSGLYTDVRYPTGIFDMLSYPSLTFYYFGQIAVYMLVVGAFYAVFNKTGVYRKVVDKIVKLFKGKEVIFFATVVVLLSTIVSFCGFSYELIFVLPLLTSIILLLGYNKMTVALTLVGSVVVGFMGATFATAIIGSYNEYLLNAYTDLIWIKVIMLVLGIALLVLYILYYNKKNKPNKKEDNSDLIAEKIEVKSKKGKVKPSWPAIVIFDLILVIMILGALDLAGAFKVSLFDTVHEAVIGFTISNYAIFSKILGSTLTNTSFGNWTASEFTIVIFLSTGILALIYRIKLSDLFDNYKEGAKKFALPAILSLLAYTLVITTSNHPFVLTILKPLLDLTDGFNSITTALSMFITSIFNIEPAYTSYAITPYLTTVVTDQDVYPLVGFISQSMQGLAMLVAPTSIILLSVISYLKVSFTEWIKKVWILALALLLVALILFTITTVLFI